MHKYFKIAIAILIIQLGVVLFLGYTLVPETKIPIHWNIENHIDGYASRDSAIIPFWLFNLGLFLLMMFSGKLSPVYKQNKERYDAIIPLMSMGLVFFFALFHIYMLLLGHHPDWQGKVQMMFILMGALFIFLGNILPKLPRNFIAGIKTPWTIYSDEIWRRTSRVGGYCFVVFGLVMLVRGVFNLDAGWMNMVEIGLLVLLIGFPVLYSFILYQKSKKEE
jgi:uncharacterized membrane protein